MAELKKGARKTVERKPARKTTSPMRKTTSLAHEHIAERADFLSLERGGDPFENRIQAERELAAA